MRTFKLIKNKLSKEDVDWYTKVNKGFMATPDVLEEYDNGEFLQGLVIFEGSFTAYGMCRDCGDHYIIARYSRYDRVDKETLKMTKDVNDI